MSRWIWIGGSLLVVGVIAAAVVASSLRGVPVDVVGVRRGPVQQYVEERAKTRLPRIHRVTMPIDGRVLAEPLATLEPNDEVQAETIVARLDTADLDTAVEEGRARLERLDAMIAENEYDKLEEDASTQLDHLVTVMGYAVASAEEQLRAARKAVDVARRDFQRVESLAADDAASQAQLNAAELKQTEAEVELAKDGLTLASMRAMKIVTEIGKDAIDHYLEKKRLHTTVLQKEREEAYQTLKRLQRDRERADVESEVSGTVLRRHVSNERVLSAGELLLEIGRLETLEVEVEVLSQEAVDVEPGQRVEIRGPSIGEVPVRGVVKRVYPRGFTKVSSLGVEQQRVLVIVRFAEGVLATLKEAGHELGADFRVTVRIITAERENALVVPRSAVFRSALGGWQAFVVRNGRAQRADLEIGLANDFEAEVLSGLQEEDVVIVAPESSLEDGARVDPRRLPGADG